MSNPNHQIEPEEVLKQYKHFRILIIGRANSGKTTLLKHISDAGIGSKLPPVYHDYRWRPSIKPTDGRGIHDINQSFHFLSNPRFVFHDSPGFETGDETQLKQVQEFIRKRSKSRRVDRQLHAIWFCLVTNASRPLLELETRFFNEERPTNVPVIAIFTKFDDLMSQVYDPELGWQENRQIAEKTLENRFKQPISKFKFPPNVCLTMEDMHMNSPSHQNQITELIEETANSLDNLTLKKLFVSVQRTNLELCLTYGCQSFYSARSTYFRLKEALFIQKYSSNCYVVTVTRLKSTASLEKNSRTPRLHLLALLTCAENSFWHYSLGVPFIQALTRSFREYKISDSRRNIEAALQQEGNNIVSSLKLARLLLENRLPPPTANDT
ncbi:hypothetical protein Clacol_005856 [Clathrus columnatus]|uniref:G domain-containing protein n=1 Tax=Clathrus columnatus TaxID=1419009 RepID=A0AAV5AI53_9AGAM|nr:hypothetical protein Clacol_005856 [Clathrus columnatus]